MAAPAAGENPIPPGFGAWAKIFGVYDDIAGVEVLTTYVPGHDGLGGWGEECTQANGSVYGAATVCALPPLRYALRREREREREREKNGVRLEVGV